VSWGKRSVTLHMLVLPITLLMVGNTHPSRSALSASASIVVLFVRFYIECRRQSAHTAVTDVGAKVSGQETRAAGRRLHTICFRPLNPRRSSSLLPLHMHNNPFSDWPVWKATSREMLPPAPQSNLTSTRSVRIKRVKLKLANT
jgi:hypothetical protein